MPPDEPWTRQHGPREVSDKTLITVVGIAAAAVVIICGIAAYVLTRIV